VTAGNGISVSSGTVAVAAPSFNSVGSYASCYRESQSGTTATGGSNYSAGTGAGQISTYETQYGVQTNNLSGTWKWMGTGATNQYATGVAVRVA
jgi:hypothetical protein